MFFESISKPLQCHAILVGCNYKHIPNSSLSGCINDILSVRKMLIDHYNVPSQNIKVLHDEDEDYDISTSVSTGYNIINALQKAITESRYGDMTQLWFHYSGHGSYIKDRSGDEADGFDECILPCDFNEKGVITDDMLFELISQISCPVFITTDCCHSGTIFDLTYSFIPTYQDGTFHTYSNVEGVELMGQNKTVLREQVDEISIPIEWNSEFTCKRVINNNKIINNKNIYMFSGCRDFQTSADITPDYQRRDESFGAFTRSLIDALSFHRFQTDYTTLYKSILYILQLRKHTQRSLFSTTDPTIIID